MLDYLEIEHNIVNYVSELIRTSRHQYPYHNLDHTKNVVSYATFLTKHYTLDVKDSFVVKSAAWFHDTGHAFGLLTGHEETSVIIMQDYLNSLTVEEDVIKKVAGCILASRVPARPQNLLEMIICDADTWHLGTPDFRITDVLVRLEMEMRLGHTIQDWISETISFMEMHRYFTDFCRTSLMAGKKENIRRLQESL